MTARFEKTRSLVRAPRRGVPVPGLAVAVWVAAGVMEPVFAVSDGFDDGDDGGWTRFDPLAGAGVAAPVAFTFPDGGYRMRAPAPAVSAAGPARAFSYREDVEVTDFFLAVDIVAWDDTIDQAFGLLARADNIGLGTTTGYVCNYNPNQNGTGAGDDPHGQFQINRVAGEAEDGTLAAVDVKLVAGRSYRMVFRGVGADLSGALYDLEDLTEPVATIATLPGDPGGGDYPSGLAGLFCFYRGDGPTEPGHVGDVTFDNFVLEAADPHPELAPGTARGVPGAIHVTGKSPASFAAFHPAADGLTLALTTLGGEAVDPDSVVLELDGEDVTAGADVVEDGGVVTVAFGTLVPDAVHRAVVTAATVSGDRTLRHGWTFDTFDAMRLGDPEFFVVEMEDYNYEGGKFLADPEAEAYLGFAGTPGIDYHDFSTGNSGDYRFSDFVATKVIGPGFDPGDTEVLGDVVRPPFDGTGAFDHAVRGTEAGEWLNHTRIFPPGRYRVFLRTAARHPQNVLLQQVTSDPGAPNQDVVPLGVFAVPTTVGTRHFIHVPLTDGEGAPTTIELLGETTLRTRIDGPDQARLQKNTLFLNYLLLARVADGGVRYGFRITDIERDATLGETRLRFNTIPGRSYAVEYKRRMSDPFWQELDDLEATGAETAFTDDDDARFAEPAGFYRVRSL